MVFGDGVNFQGSRATATGSRKHWAVFFFRQDKMVIALLEPEMLLG